MRPHGEPHQISDEHQPAVAPRPIGNVLPLENGPENNGCKERRQGVHLGLDGREPEGVGPGIGQRSDRGGTDHGPALSVGKFVLLFAVHAPPEMRDAPKEEGDGQAALQGRKGINRPGHQGRITGKDRSQPVDKKEERGSRRVSHFEFITGGDKFAAIPQAGGGLHGQQIGEAGDRENDPTAPQAAFTKTAH